MLQRLLQNLNENIQNIFINTFIGLDGKKDHSFYIFVTAFTENSSPIPFLEQVIEFLSVTGGDYDTGDILPVYINR